MEVDYLRIKVAQSGDEFETECTWAQDAVFVRNQFYSRLVFAAYLCTGGHINKSIFDMRALSYIAFN